jgi:steroid delta-isomerase-like uncharacterized protein
LQPNNYILLTFETQSYYLEDKVKKHFMILSLALILCFMVGCQDKEAMAELEEFKAQAEVEEQNKAVVRRLIEEGINKEDYDLAKSLLSDDFINHSPRPAIPPTKAAFKQSYISSLGAFSDLKYTIQYIVAKNDIVVVHWTATGKHTGKFMGMSPSRHEMNVTGICLFRLADEQVVELWLFWDQIGIMQQLGMELKPKEEK